jgi:hypothetical protein
MRRTVFALALAGVLCGAESASAGPWRRAQPTCGGPVVVAPAGTFAPLTGQVIGVVPPAPWGRVLGVVPPAPWGRVLGVPGAEMKPSEPLVMPAPKPVPDKK